MFSQLRWLSKVMGWVWKWTNTEPRCLSGALGAGVCVYLLTASWHLPWQPDSASLPVWNHSMCFEIQGLDRNSIFSYSLPGDTCCLTQYFCGEEKEQKYQSPKGSKYIVPLVNVSQCSTVAKCVFAAAVSLVGSCLLLLLLEKPSKDEVEKDREFIVLSMMCWCQ